MAGARSLIVNADDFGQSPAINRGIIQAHEQGIVTSTSFMVLWPATAEAASYARAHRGLGVGLHVDLGEWIFRGGAWMPLYERVVFEDEQAVAHEISRQVTLFHEFIGAPPSHLDSHQHVHLREPVRSVMIDLAKGLHVPLRGCGDGVQTYGGFYGQTAEGEPAHEAISIERLLQILADLPEGVTELSCHPAASYFGSDGNEPETMYQTERSLELSVLCDPRARAAVAAHDIRLCSFQEFRRP